MTESALRRINNMSGRELEKLALRIAKELGFDIKGTRVTGDRVEMDSYLHLPAGEILHYLLILSRSAPRRTDIQEIIDRVNNPFVRILYMTTEEGDDETREFCTEKGIELAEWDRLMQLLERYGILRELEREPEKEAYLPSIGEVNSLIGWAKDFLEEGNTEKAMEYTDRALSIKPDYPVLLKLKGDILYRLGRLEESEDLYRKAVNTGSDDSELWRALSRVLDEEGKKEEALRALHRATELNPRSYELWLEKGLMLYERGMYEEALLCFTKAKDIDPSGKEAWNDTGLALKRMGKFEDAVNAFNQAIKIDAGFWDALLNKALLLHERGSLEDAVAIYNHMLKIRADPRIMCQKGFALEEMGRMKEAMESFEKALQSDPSLGPCREELLKISGQQPVVETEEVPAEPEISETKTEEITEEVQESQETEEVPDFEDMMGVKKEKSEEERKVAGLAAFVSAIKEVEGGAEEEIEEEDIEVRDIREIKPEEWRPKSVEVGEIFESGETVPEVSEEQEKFDEGLKGENEDTEEEVQQELEKMEQEVAEALEDALKAEPEERIEGEIEEMIEDEIYRTLVSEEEELRSMEIGVKAQDVELSAGEEEEVSEPPEEPGEVGGRKRVLEGITALSQLMIRGEIYYKLERFEEAEECYEALTEAKPNSKEIWNMYGCALFRNEKYAKAQKAFEKALELDESFRDAMLNLMELYRVSGSFHKSLELMNTLLRNEKENYMLWIKRGKMLESMEREGASVQSYTKALDVETGMIRVWNALGISLWDIEEYDDALKAFENGINMDERDPMLWNNYGAVLYTVGKREEAIEAMERSLAENLHYAPANNNMGVILAHRGDINGARERFNLALESDGNAIYAYNNTKYL